MASATRAWEPDSEPTMNCTTVSTTLSSTLTQVLRWLTLCLSIGSTENRWRVEGDGDGEDMQPLWLDLP